MMYNVAEKVSDNDFNNELNRLRENLKSCGTDCNLYNEIYIFLIEVLYEKSTDNDKKSLYAALKKMNEYLSGNIKAIGKDYNIFVDNSNLLKDAEKKLLTKVNTVMKNNEKILGYDIYKKAVLEKELKERNINGFIPSVIGVIALAVITLALSGAAICTGNPFLFFLAYLAGCKTYLDIKTAWDKNKAREELQDLKTSLK